MKQTLFIAFALLGFSLSQAQSSSSTVVNKINPAMKEEFYEVLKESALNLEETRGFVLNSTSVSMGLLSKVWEKKIKKNFPSWFENTPFKGVVEIDANNLPEGFHFMQVNALKLGVDVTITITIKNEDFRTLYSARARNVSVSDLLAKMGITTY